MSRVMRPYRVGRKRAYSKSMGARAVCERCMYVVKHAELRYAWDGLLVGPCCDDRPPSFLQIPETQDAQRLREPRPVPYYPEPAEAPSWPLPGEQ